MMRDTPPVRFDREKFKNVVHYICSSCDAHQLGAVKLHKVLYFADMLHYAFQGKPLTGSTYRKRPLGPTSDELPPTLRQLEAERAVQIRKVDYFGYVKTEYASLTEPDTSHLSNFEHQLLDECIEFVCRNNTAKTISEFSHNRAWEIAKPGEVLPYHSAFLLFPTQVSQEAMNWAASEATKLESQEAGGKPLVRRSYGDFRARVLAARGEA